MRKKYKVNALVTLYEPNRNQVNNVKKIRDQTDSLILCDNSLNDNQKLFSEIPDAVYLFWGENRGLSKAFNTVLMDQGFGWDESDYVIFFDQDTVIPDRHVEKLVLEYQSLKNQNQNAGCLGPVYYNTSSQMLEVPRKKIPITKHVLKVKSVITSSMLCEYGNLKQIGFWNEEIFLDMSDWDLCWRFLEQGFLCCMTDVSIVRHSIGEGERKIGPARMRIGKPFREYYQIRDCLYLLHKTYTPCKFRLRFVLMLLVRSPLHILLFADRKDRLKFILQAVRDYRDGVRGPLAD